MVAVLAAGSLGIPGSTVVGQSPHIGSAIASQTDSRIHGVVPANGDSSSTSVSPYTIAYWIREMADPYSQQIVMRSGDGTSSNEAASTPNVPVVPMGAPSLAPGNDGSGASLVHSFEFGAPLRFDAPTTPGSQAVTQDFVDPPTLFRVAAGVTPLFSFDAPTPPAPTPPAPTTTTQDSQNGGNGVGSGDSQTIVQTGDAPVFTDCGAKCGPGIFAPEFAPIIDAPVVASPEPATASLLGLGMSGVALLGLRRRTRSALFTK